MPFCSEKDFEDALVEKLHRDCGWSADVLCNPSEADLIQNWADILFENNRSIDRLDEYPLTKGEMQQIIAQVNGLETPLKLNGFINGRTVTITRDNAQDKRHCGREVSLKIYDRMEIAAGQSRYQIVRQPHFSTRSALLSDRRGDLMLLINGMPVVHIELKKSGIPISQACNQIEKYAREGVYTNLFSLVQIFVAMNPEDAVYFANPGHRGSFNADYYFHWADFNNEPVKEWNKFAQSLLSIPMAHQLIGFYTVADDTDGILKVMRSYQYQAANAISDKVAKCKWMAEPNGSNQRGGFIWHTTGSGKTMSSFKSAQLIASSGDADKVVFLMDRIELGTQSLQSYRGFAQADEDVQATENTGVLVGKLKSGDASDTLIVTSIQKMSNIGDEGEYALKSADLDLIRSKRIVFIVDECHRSTFGTMLQQIKRMFPCALFFGFTGTPIYDENNVLDNTTSTVFGNELHRYTIADGIRDKNVLGFDPYKVMTYKDSDIRRAIALEKAKARDEQEANADAEKRAIFYKYMTMPMPMKYVDSTGAEHHGIESHIKRAQYHKNEHRNKVVEDILEHWHTLSHCGKFHAIFATSSINEAIAYYRLFTDAKISLKVTALFDPSIDNNDAGASIDKENGLETIISDYNARYKQKFTAKTFPSMKRDIAARLAHKQPYSHIAHAPEEQLDLLIVVNQMLTGFDSKWVNTLYLDKLMYFESIIQAFSRTNRLFGQDKPFGTIKYYRYPHTMEQNIADAVKLYCGDRKIEMFVDKLEQNIRHMNELYKDICSLFTQNNVCSLGKLPESEAQRKEFVKLFNEFNGYLEAAKVQGFLLDKTHYEYTNEQGKDIALTTAFDKDSYEILLRRYQDLQAASTPTDETDTSRDIPYDLKGYITSIQTDRIDDSYMNEKFIKFIKAAKQSNISDEERERTRNELHKTFARLSQEEQKVANILLHEMQREDFMYEEGKTFHDYIAAYRKNEHSTFIHDISVALGLNEIMLSSLMKLHVTKENLNKNGRYDDLQKTVDTQKAAEYFTAITGKKLLPFMVMVEVDKLLRRFIVSDGFAIEKPDMP
jgi:type I restriction enzyme R subunit